MDKLRFRISLALGCFGVVCILSPILLGQTGISRFRSPSVETRDTDAILQADYDRLYSLTDAHGRERLETTQRVWSRFRDAQCKFDAGGAQNPEAQAAAYARAHERLTQMRISTLNAQIGEMIRAQGPHTEAGK